MKKKRRLPIPVAIIIYIVTTLLTLILIVGSGLVLSYSQIVSVFTGQATTKHVNKNEPKDATYFASDFDSNKALHAYTKKLGQEIVEEAIVLLKKIKKHCL